MEEDMEDMADAKLEIIDAFIDGERVETSDLKRALADERGRDYFVDAWILRESLQDVMSVEAAPAAAPVAARAPRRVSWPIAASIAAACLASGFGIASFVNRGTPDAPAVTPQTTIEATAKDSAFPAPPPTRVIRLEMDVNWRESRGGN
jgi:hypothetical protein